MYLSAYKSIQTKQATPSTGLGKIAEMVTQCSANTVRSTIKDDKLILDGALALFVSSSGFWPSQKWISGIVGLPWMILLHLI